MYKLVTIALISLAGWTIGANAVVLAGGTLRALMLAGPFCVVMLAILFRALPVSLRSSAPIAGTTSGPDSMTNPAPYVVATLLALVLLRLSWNAFWLASVLILAAYCFPRRNGNPLGVSVTPIIKKHEYFVVLAIAIAASLLTLWVSRSDYDDAFYVGVAAFVHGHPGFPLLGGDPMFGEHGWPLIFPSYRFTSYELLAAAIAQLSGAPAMDVMHEWLPPIAAGFTVVAIFFLSREIAHRKWLAVGVVTLILGLLLGECHRGPANFMFVRIFQGKAIYLSALLPIIYALTFRYVLSERAPRELMLLCCAQFASVGISNFAMLAAPMAGATALLSMAACVPKSTYPRILIAACTLLIPLPYLVFVAIASKSGADIVGAPESASAVWTTVFGEKQQYLVALLLLAGPAFAGNFRTRTWLAMPSLILLGICLNPVLASFISHYVTTPPVYWRVTWCLPILAYISLSFCLAAGRTGQLANLNNPALWVVVASFALAIYSSPFNVLSKKNGVEWHFAQAKIPVSELAVARRAIELAAPDSRVLAPESISSILPMFEHHPALIGVRDMYLHMLAPAIGSSDYDARALLLGLVSGQPPDALNHEKIAAALEKLNVSVAVTNGSMNGSDPAEPVLVSNGFVRAETIDSFVIWRRDNISP